jgi:hypothetical protein
LLFAVRQSLFTLILVHGYLLLLTYDSI